MAGLAGGITYAWGMECLRHYKVLTMVYLLAHLETFISNVTIIF